MQLPGRRSEDLTMQEGIAIALAGQRKKERAQLSTGKHVRIGKRTILFWQGSGWRESRPRKGRIKGQQPGGCQVQVGIVTFLHGAVANALTVFLLRLRGTGIGGI